MFAYNIQTVNLYLNRTQILIPRMKRNATMRTKKRSLNTAWIDYRKAFGSVLFCFCFVILFNVGHNTKVAHIYLHI